MYRNSVDMNIHLFMFQHCVYDRDHFMAMCNVLFLAPLIFLAKFLCPDWSSLLQLFMQSKNTLRYMMALQ